MIIAQTMGAYLVSAVTAIAGFLVCLYIMTRLLPAWVQAVTAGVPLRVLDLVGMRLRRTDVRAVVGALVMAHQAGAPLAVAEVERASLQGADLEKLVLAFVRAKQDGLDLSFAELVDADRQDRLEERLGGGKAPR